MLHLHNRYMRGTKLDGIVAIMVLLFALFLLSMAFGPARTLAQERDQVRTADVRELMTKVLQLELVDPEAYRTLVEEVASHPGQVSVIGQGSCGGSSGAYCQAEITADECLRLQDYFSPLLLAAVPVDPRSSTYSAVATGYYLTVVEDELEVGACGAARHSITLRNSLD